MLNLEWFETHRVSAKFQLYISRLPKTQLIPTAERNRLNRKKRIYRCRLNSLCSHLLVSHEFLVGEGSKTGSIVTGYSKA